MTYKMISSDQEKIALLARLLKAEAITVEEFALLVTDTYSMSIPQPYTNPWINPYQLQGPYYGSTSTATITYIA